MYYITGEYRSVPNGYNLVSRHAVELLPGGAASTAVCGYAYDPARLRQADWASPREMVGGLRCPDCVTATSTTG